MSIYYRLTAIIASIKRVEQFVRKNTGYTTVRAPNIPLCNKLSDKRLTGGKDVRQLFPGPTNWLTKEYL